MEVEASGERVRFEGVKQRKLFVVLALRAPEAVSAEELLEVLWGDVRSVGQRPLPVLTARPGGAAARSGRRPDDNRWMLRRVAGGRLAVLGALAVSAPAGADLADEEALARKYAPVVRLVVQEEACGYGEPYVPIDVDLLFGEATVALRGPWGPSDLIRIAPTGADLSKGLYEHHLDFPGDALDPRCDYERWSDRLTGSSQPTTYAHVANDPGHPGQLALQYGFFYPFNDFNNKHEGDWELIQLVFDAGTAAAALEREPREVGYSQHEGAERAAWDDEKLELVDGTHPVVHVAAGSHANYFDEALYLGRSAEQGVGCDDTTVPTLDLRPTVRTIPRDTPSARRAFPWLAYEGRWGELHEAFYNGPTGPNLKRQWTAPIAWVDDAWRDHSYAVPAGGVLGTGATDFFCSAVESGSDALRRAIQDPLSTIVVLVTLLALVVFALTRTTWRPAAPLHVGRRRAWGQVLAAAARMYRRRWSLFVGIALVFLPITILLAVLQGLVFRASGIAGVDMDAESGGAVAFVVLALSATATLTGLGLVQGATARAVAAIDAGEPISPVEAYRRSLRRFPRLLGAIVLAVVVVALLTVTLALVPVAVWLTGRWALAVPAVELEGASSLGALRRSGELVAGRWLKVVSLVVVSAALALVLGPLIGALLVLLTSAPFALLNIVAGVVCAVAMPLVALTTVYVYFDALARERVEPRAVADELPAEIPALG